MIIIMYRTEYKIFLWIQLSIRKRITEKSVTKKSLLLLHYTSQRTSQCEGAKNETKVTELNTTKLISLNSELCYDDMKVLATMR